MPSVRAFRRPRLARRRLLHAPDLFRFLRLLGHGHRPGPDVRLPFPRELPLAVRRRHGAGILAALAHLALDLVSRLPVRAARREPRLSPARTYVNLVTVFFLCGLWHGASWNFVVWGLFHGTFLVIERLGLAAAVRRLWAPLRHAYLLLVVMVGWVFFRADTLGGAAAFLKAMFGFGMAAPTEFSVSWYLTPALWLALAAGAIGSAPLVPWLARWRHQTPAASAGVDPGRRRRCRPLADPGRLDPAGRGAKLQPVHLFPILMLRSAANGVLAVIFVLVVSLPLGANLSGGDGFDPAAENREPARFPALDGTWASLADYPRGLGRWFDDHFGFRARSRAPERRDSVLLSRDLSVVGRPARQGRMAVLRGRWGDGGLCQRAGAIGRGGRELASVSRPGARLAARTRRRVRLHGPARQARHLPGADARVSPPHRIHVAHGSGVRRARRRRRRSRPAAGALRGQDARTDLSPDRHALERTRGVRGVPA